VLKYSGAVFALLLLGFGTYVYWFSVARLEPEAKIYVVAPGTSLKAFARQLRNEKVLPDANTLVWIAYLKGQSRELKTGEYRFRKGITALEILEQVMSGRVVEYPLTIAEGWTQADLGAGAAAHPYSARPQAEADHGQPRLPDHAPRGPLLSRYLLLLRRHV
jgi:UPF0755 protein